MFLASAKNKKEGQPLFQKGCPSFLYLAFSGLIHAAAHAACHCCVCSCFSSGVLLVGNNAVAVYIYHADRALRRAVRTYWGRCDCLYLKEPQAP